MLLERDLVDELNLGSTVLVGDGLQLFPDSGQTHDLTLVGCHSLSSAYTSEYRPAGRATFGSASWSPRFAGKQ
jgi:hypothetical protein